MNTRNLPCFVCFVAFCVGPATFDTIAAGPTNSWTKPASGSWEEAAYWSQGLPSSGQGAIMFTNEGYKALAIGANTSANFSNSLTIQNVVLGAPADSSNQLLMNFSGLAVPLTVQGDFNVGAYASLVSHYAAIHAGKLLAQGPVIFSDESALTANVVSLLGGSSFTFNSGLATLGDLNLETEGQSGTALCNILGGSVQVQNIVTMGRAQSQMLNARGDFILSNALLRASSLNLNDGIFTQVSRTNETSTITIASAGETPLAEYHLFGGALISAQMVLGGYSSGTLIQSGGVHSNSGSIVLWGLDRSTTHNVFGRYNLNGGTLSSPLVDLKGGGFTQSAGTNQVRVISVTSNGSYGLSGGSLSSSNVVVSSSDTRGFYSAIEQEGGAFAIEGSLSVGRSGNFALHGGTITVSNFSIGDGSSQRQARFRAASSFQGGTVNNPGRFSLTGGDTFFSGQYQLGLLDIGAGASTLGFGAAGTVVRFVDSHLEPLSSGTLSVVGWNGWQNGRGSHQLYVGTNAQGFSSAQLKQITFDNPGGGLPAGTYPARILSTGEIIPGPRPTLSFSQSAHAMVLSWSGNYQLFTSTNVAGTFTPISGATSPYTASFTDPQRFFELRSP